MQSWIAKVMLCECATAKNASKEHSGVLSGTHEATRLPLRSLTQRDSVRDRERTPRLRSLAVTADKSVDGSGIPVSTPLLFSSARASCASGRRRSLKNAPTTQPASTPTPTRRKEQNCIFRVCDSGAVAATASPRGSTTAGAPRSSGQVRPAKKKKARTRLQQRTTTTTPRFVSHHGLGSAVSRVSA